MKKLFILLTILVLTLLSSHPSDAHFLASDNNIGAVLHVDPNDDPVAGEQASFIFEFKDKENKFQPKNCDCTFSITENGNEIFSQSLFQNSQNSTGTTAIAAYTFPKKDVYQVKVVGKPLSPHAFQPFSLTWDFRVDQEANKTTTAAGNKGNFFTTHLVHFIGIGIILLFFIFQIIYNIFHRKKFVSKANNKKETKGNKSNIY